MLGLVGPLAYSGQLAAAHSLRSEAVRAALPLGDPALLARVIVAFDVPRAVFFREFGDTDHKLVGTIKRTLSELPPGDHPLRCRLLTTLASELELAESERGYEAAEEAVAMARRLGEPGLLAMALTSQRMQSFRQRHGRLPRPGPHAPGDVRARARRGRQSR